MEINGRKICFNALSDVNFVLQWEELRGEFEQLEYLREILKDHIGRGSSKTV